MGSARARLFGSCLLLVWSAQIDENGDYDPP